MDPVLTEPNPFRDLAPRLLRTVRAAEAATLNWLGALRRLGSFDERARECPGQVHSELGSTFHNNLVGQLSELAKATEGLAIVAERDSEGYHTLLYRERHRLVLRGDYKNVLAVAQCQMFQDARGESSLTTTILSTELRYPRDLIIEDVSVRKALLVQIDGAGAVLRSTSLLPRSAARMAPLGAGLPPVVRPRINPAITPGRPEVSDEEEEQE